MGSRAGFGQVQLSSIWNEESRSSIETGCVRVQSSRYQSYTWKEGVEGGMGNKEATWERIGGV